MSPLSKINSGSSVSKRASRMVSKSVMSSLLSRRVRKPRLTSQSPS